jgi:L-alanine-DL-glutamate epimerase-like enolase superfamily enzyme
MGIEQAPGPYEDLDAFLNRADELARSLLDEGITGMKIWPFDPFAEASGGHYISGADLHSALEPFRKIRRAVGDAMDIMVEFHSLWDLTTAKRITHALEDFNPYWYEDPIKMDNLAALGELSAVDACAHHGERDARHTLVVPPAAGAARGRDRHARRVLVRRAERGAQDRSHRRGAPAAGRTA